MGLLREDAMTDNGGHQEVSSTFAIEDHLANV